MNNSINNNFSFLSDSEIEGLVNDGKLFRKNTFSIEQLSACAYDLRAGEQLVSRNHAATIDLGNTDYPVYPGEVVTITTIEWIDLSDPYLIGMICNNHTQISKGIFHPITIIDPGFNGKLAITLINSGNNVYIISKGKRISKLILAKISAEPIRTYGDKYIPRARPGALQHALHFEKTSLDKFGWENLADFFGPPHDMIINKINDLEEKIEDYNLKAELSMYRKIFQWIVMLMAGAIGGIIANNFYSILNFLQKIFSH